LKKKFEEVQMESSLMDRIDFLKDVISGDSLLMVSEYRYRIEVLKNLRFIDDKNFVLLKGKVALEISMSELFITQLIIENVFSQMQPCEIVSLLSAIVYQQKSNQTDENFHKTSFKNVALDNGRDKMIQIAQYLNKVQTDCHLQIANEDDFVEELNFGLVQVVFEWSKGVSFVKIKSLTDTQEGIIVRTIQRLDELCGNLRNAAKIIGDTVLESKIEQCSVLIRRDIVFTGSLYTK
jgi:antiviral helicase SKI2